MRRVKSVPLYQFENGLSSASWEPRRLSEQIGDGMEGDSCGSGLEGTEHRCRSKGGCSVFLVELVHRGEQAGAALGVLQGVEEVEGVEAAGDEAVELDAYEIRLVVFGACGPLGPKTA